MMTDNKLVIPLVVTLSRMTFQNKVHWNTSKPVIWQICSWISHMIFHAGVKMDQWADLSQLNLDAHVWTNPLGSLILLRGKSCSRSTPFPKVGTSQSQNYAVKLSVPLTWAERVRTLTHLGKMDPTHVSEIQLCSLRNSLSINHR